MRLHRELAEKTVDGLAGEFGLSREVMAEGILNVVNAQMANAIRSVTVAKGIDPRRFALVAFGGAGPMHAPFIAAELGMDQVIVPRAAGAFSAWGMLTTELRHDASQTFIVALEELHRSNLETSFSHLEEGLRSLLSSEGVSPADMRFRRSLDMRYRGQEYFINVAVPDAVWSAPVLKRLFDEQYEKTYGHKNLAEEVETVNLRVEARGRLGSGKLASAELFPDSRDGERPASRTGKAVFDGRSRDTVFVERASLSAAELLEGPSIVEETSATTVVPPGFQARLDRFGNLRVQRKEASP
jgi:N-methylhydantoinase A